MSVSCMFVSCVHLVAVLNAALCMTCLIGSHECLLLLTHTVVVSAFIICSGLCACTEML